MEEVRFSKLNCRALGIEKCLKIPLVKIKLVFNMLLFSSLTVSPNSTQSELYSTALTSPESPTKILSSKLDSSSQITITLSSTPNSTSNSVPRPQESPKKGTLGRTESRKKKRKSFYELSPDISDKHVQLLEKNYGGKEKANNAARIIQQHYRSWNMKKTYCRLRTQSEARRTSVKGRLSKRGSLRSPLSSGSLSPTGAPIPLNLNVNLNEFEERYNSSLKTPETETRQRQNSPKEEFIAIEADINVDSNFVQVDASKGDFSVRRVSEDISSIEISKNLLNDSIGQKKIFDEVFQQILSPRKDSLSLAVRSDSLRSKKGERPSIVMECVKISETVSELEVVPDDATADGVDGQCGVEGTNNVEMVQVDEVNVTNGEKQDSVEIQINVEREQVVMMMDTEQDGLVLSNDNLSVKEERGTYGGYKIHIPAP